MTKWYVKDLSKLTGVSVQTLHHYDRIDLLNPSLRLDNGYRVYTEKDLLKLQQIIALKYFGFELTQIKSLLTADLNMMEHFSAQSKLLQQKADTLQEASRTLTNIVSMYHDNKSIPWETIIETIEVYNMTNDIENSWVGKVLNKAEMEQYAKFAKGLESRFTPADQAQSEKNWSLLVKEVNANLKCDPTTDKSMDIAGRLLQWVHELYGYEHVALRMAIWEKGFKANQNGDLHGLTPEAVKWLDLAIRARCRKQYQAVLNQAGKKSDAEVISAFSDFLQDTYGDYAEPKKMICQTALADNDVNEAAKVLLRKMK